MRSSSTAARRTRAVESFRNAADAIGPVVPGLSVFAVTRGQFSMIDVVSHLIEAAAPCELTLWTWTIADYEVQAFSGLANDGRIASASLIIDRGALSKNRSMINLWRKRFGDESVRYTMNHAKIATVTGAGLRLCARGSMNLNHNPRFEQLDVTEGGADYDLIRQIATELPHAPADDYDALAKAARIDDAFDRQQLDMFRGLKRWAK